MKKTQKLTFVSHTEFKRKLLKDPEYKKIHDKLAFESELIEALIRARIEKKITQKELAKKIGMVQSALARFESGKVNPTLSFVHKVTKGLGLELTVR